MLHAPWLQATVAACRLYRLLLHAGGGVFTLPSHALLIGGPVTRPHRLALPESIPRARPPLFLEGILSQGVEKGGVGAGRLHPCYASRHRTRGSSQTRCESTPSGRATGVAGATNGAPPTATHPIALLPSASAIVRGNGHTRANRTRMWREVLMMLRGRGARPCRNASEARHRW